ncbi:hypothetical protein [Endozoicomonas sp. ALD040]|uniref:hypothetical protein n=1 Tax=unclassified Endozoicomonas TaxID=2644528 RepID=UPI003BAF6F13
MKRSDHSRTSLPIAAWILPSILLAGCANPLESISCYYQPVRGTMLINEVKGDLAELDFFPDTKQDLVWFRKHDIEPEGLVMPISNVGRAPKPSSRHKAIVNILTSGSCSPYIVYQGEPVLAQ